MTPDANAHLAHLATTSPEACYLAMQMRDARFDGRFFVGVSSTGIYCRPVCRVKLPKAENCRFFGHAAQAEKAGYRPCLRCRPELAPESLIWSIQDASRILTQHAVRLLDEPGDDTLTVKHLAARLGVSDRHLRRIFEAQLGVSPVQYLQTRRLLTAKQLLADTDLPITQVVSISGFASVRRFNAAFAKHYHLNPTQLRREGKDMGKGNIGSQNSGESGELNNGIGCTVRLGYRPPYDVAAMLAFFRNRQMHGVEFVEAPFGPLRLGRTLRLTAGNAVYQGWLVAEFDPARCHVRLQVSASLREMLPLVIRRVRTLLDLDADPTDINAVLHPFFPQGDGLRVPGTVDGFELAVRAVLGQQITVAAARTLAQRLVTRFGEALATPPQALWPALTHLFPSPVALAEAGGDALGQLGIVKQRQTAIVAIAKAVAENRISLHGGIDVQATVTALKALPGIGDWTAQYIAMRALRWPDAFPAGDVALHKALGVQRHEHAKKLSPQHATKEAEALSQAWKPWRSYAVLRAWSAGEVAKIQN